MTEINGRLKPIQANLYTFTPTDISKLEGQSPYTFALEAVDEKGRRIYVRMSPPMLRILHRRLGHVIEQPWFLRKVAEFNERVRRIVVREQHPGVDEQQPVR